MNQKDCLGTVAELEYENHRLLHELELLKAKYGISAKGAENDQYMKISKMIIPWFERHPEISEHFEPEQEIIGLAFQLRSILENVSDGVLVYSKDGKLLEINRAASNIAGWKNGKRGTYYRVDVNVFKMFDMNNIMVDTSNRPVQRAIRGEKYFMDEFRVLNCQTGEEYYFDYSASPVFNDRDELLFSVITVHDITQRKKEDIERSQVLNELENSHTLLESVMRIAAHDLRGPIGTIAMGLDLMEKLNDLSKKAEFMTQIKLMIKRLEKTVNGLLEVLKIQSVESYEYYSINLDDLSRDILDDLQDHLDEKKGVIRFDFHLAPDIRYIKPFLESILKNLISNAIKYHHDHRDLIIDVTSYRLEDYVVLKVTDNGMGIDLKQNGEDLFKPFRRFTEKGNGVGVGLYLTKKILEKNGGSICLKSHPDIGTTFYCNFREYI